jgi:hypothetical protein
MTPIEEKEKRVLKLLEEGWNFKDIAKEEHVSFSFISIVNKKRLGQDPTLKKQLSIPTLALKLFSEGKSIIEVTIILDRPTSEIREYYYDYLRLRGIDSLVSLIEAHKDHLPTIIKLIKYIIQNSFAKNDLVATLALVKEIPRLKSTKKNLEEKIESLTNTRSRLLNSRQRMNQISY